MQNSNCHLKIVTFLTVVGVSVIPSTVEATCICIQYPYLNFGSYTLYYAHQHADCPPTQCNEFDPVYVAGPPGLPSEVCPDDCYSARLANSKKYIPKLPRPVPADWNIHYAGVRNQPALTLVTERTNIKPLYYRIYSFKHPDSNSLIRAKVFLTEVTPKSDKNQEPRLVAFGLEVQDDGSDAILVKKARRHPTLKKYVYEFEIESAKCVVVTSVP
jgi:hypothetical protein